MLQDIEKRFPRPVARRPDMQALGSDQPATAIAAGDDAHVD